MKGLSAGLPGFGASETNYTTVLSVGTEGFGVGIEHYIARS